MKTLFTFANIRTLFGFKPVLGGTQGSAMASVGTSLIGIGNVLAEGKVAPEHAEIALQKLYEAQLAVNQAITVGWNNGAATQY